MTTPEGNAGESPSARARAVTFLLRKPLTVGRAAGIIASGHGVGDDHQRGGDPLHRPEELP